MITIDNTDKNIIITGGTSTIGLSLVKQYALSGGNVAFTYNHNKEKAMSLISEINKDNVKAYYLDQGNINSINKVIDNIVSDFGNIDILINNAGIYPSKKFSEISEADYDQMLDTNTKGLFFLSRYVSKHMNTNSSIVNISSINATNPCLKLIHYGISKAGVEMLTKCLAYEFKDLIRVNCIAPGLVYKKGQEEFIGTWVESYKQRASLKHLVYPVDVANTALFLSSPLANSITGQIITVDAGVSLAPYFNNEE